MDITLVCEETFDGIMTAIYDGWVYMNKGYSVHIIPGEVYEYGMFTEYKYIDTDLEKAIKVASSIRKKISWEAYELVFRTCMHYESDRAEVVFDFLKVGYKAGNRITNDLGNDAVMKIMEYSRKVGNESHLFKGFVRFKEIQNNILYSRISPKCDVIPLIAPHFDNRYPQENWIIYDETRKKAAVHKAGERWIMISGTDVEVFVEGAEDDDGYEKLWKVFFDTIGIKERLNPKCQGTMLPKWYRKNMLEFENESS